MVHISWSKIFSFCFVRTGLADFEPLLFGSLLIFSIGKVTKSFVTTGLPVTKGPEAFSARGNRNKFLGLRQWASERGGEEGFRLQSQEGQDLCVAAAAE
jgi:hypothetical protein